jgi:matrixin
VARVSPRWLACLLSVLLVGLLLGTALASLTPLRPRWLGLAAGALPALPSDASARPLGVPESAPSGAGGFRVLEHEDDGSGSPVRWDPCRPVHYVVRPAGAPPTGPAALAAALARVSRLTGLRFVADGPTSETPREHRPTMDPARYGDRWSPVLVAWTDPAEYPPMAGYAGLGGPDAVSGSAPGSRRFVTGVVLLNRDHLTTVSAWPDGPARVESIILHELGHLLGLDHVDDPAQLMYRQPVPHPGWFGAGDRRGLAALADGPCFRDF